MDVPSLLASAASSLSTVDETLSTLPGKLTASTTRSLLRQSVMTASPVAYESLRVYVSSRWNEDDNNDNEDEDEDEDEAEDETTPASKKKRPNPETVLGTAEGGVWTLPSCPASTATKSAASLVDIEITGSFLNGNRDAPFTEYLDRIDLTYSTGKSKIVSSSASKTLSWSRDIVSSSTQATTPALFSSSTVPSTSNPSIEASLVRFSIPVCPKSVIIKISRRPSPNSDYQKYRPSTKLLNILSPITDIPKGEASLDDIILAFQTYAREKDLFDPADRCYIHCDSGIRNIFQDHFKNNNVTKNTKSSNGGNKRAKSTAYNESGSDVGPSDVDSSCRIRFSNLRQLLLRSPSLLHELDIIQINYPSPTSRKTTTIHADINVAVPSLHYSYKAATLKRSIMPKLKIHKTSIAVPPRELNNNSNPLLTSSVEVETFKAKTITYITNTGVNPNIARHVVESINIEGLLLGGIDVTDITANSSIYRAKRRIVNPTSTNSPYNEYSTQDITRTLLVLSSALTSHIDSEFISYCRSTPQDLREPESVTKARDFIAASDIIKLEARRVYLEGKLKESEDKAARLDRAIKATEGK